MTTGYKKPKKQRSDSVTADIAAFATAGQDSAPPQPLSDDDMKHWRQIVKARAKDDWTEIDLMHAWNLARIMGYIDQSHDDIAANGMTLTSERGTPIDNPAFSRLEKLSRLAMTYSTKLHIHAEATVGRSADSSKRATKQRQAEAVKSSLQENELGDFIAQPTLN